MPDKVYIVDDSSLFHIRFFVSFRQVLQAFWTITMQKFEPENPKNNKTNKSINLINI